MSGDDEGQAGAVWKPNYCLQGVPSELLARARPETSQEPEGGLFPGADGSPGETGLGQNVTFLGSLAGMWGWKKKSRLAPGLTHPQCTGRSVSLKRQPSAHRCSNLASSCPSHTESRPNATLCIPSPFQASPRLPHRLIPCQSFPEPCAPAKWICCSEAGSSVSPPPPRLCSHHFISLRCPSPQSSPASPSSPRVSCLPTLPATQTPRLSEPSLVLS